MCLCLLQNVCHSICARCVLWEIGLQMRQKSNFPWLQNVTERYAQKESVEAKHGNKRGYHQQVDFTWFDAVHKYGGVQWDTTETMTHIQKLTKRQRENEIERERLHFEFDAIILSTQCEAIEWQPHRVCVSASNGRTLFRTDRVANESCYGCNPFIRYYSTAQQGKLCNDNVPSLFDLDNTRIENLNQCLISIRLKELIHR